MNETLKEFKKNGFILFNSGLNAKKIEEIRKIILNNIKDGEKKELYIDYAIENKEIFDLFFLPNIVRKLRELSSEIFYLADLNIQINQINNKGKNKGWHIDANFENYLKQQYLFSTDYRFYKVGIYFQENTLQFGGGIDIKKKGHKAFKNLGKVKLNNLYRTSYNYLTDLIPFNKKRIPIKSGEVLIFDSRLPHASSASKTSTENITKNNMKMNFYWDVAGRKEDANNYLNSLIIRSYLSKNKENKKFNANVLRHNFPKTFKKYQLEQLNNNNISFATLDEFNCNFFENLFNKNG